MVLRHGVSQEIYIYIHTHTHKIESYDTTWQLGKGSAVEHAYRTKEPTYHRWWKISHNLQHPQMVCQNSTVFPKEEKN